MPTGPVNTTSVAGKRSRLIDLQQRHLDGIDTATRRVAGSSGRPASGVLAVNAASLLSRGLGGPG
jgi:hypothetical protein